MRPVSAVRQAWVTGAAKLSAAADTVSAFQVPVPVMALNNISAPVLLMAAMSTTSPEAAIDGADQTWIVAFTDSSCQVPVPTPGAKVRE
jgi:hypothetical protein